MIQGGLKVHPHRTNGTFAMHLLSGTAPSSPARGRRPASAAGLAIVVGAMLAGCTEPQPPAAPRPAAVARAHAHDHDHGHGKSAAKAADHGDHQHPHTLAAGVAEIQSLWGKVRTAIGKGDRDQADEHVHEVGHLLEDLEGLLAAVPEEAREGGKKAMEEIFDCFDTLDTAFHGAEDDWKKVDLDALSPRLEAAFKTLSGLGGGNGK
jgi:hypothetical protein